MLPALTLFNLQVKMRW